MKNISLLAIALCSLLSTLPLRGQPLRGIPEFGDDFNVTGLFIENWEPSKLTVSEGGRAIIPTGNNMFLRRIPEGRFAFSADVTLREPEERSGHGGITLDGIHFMLTPGGSANTAYRVPGETRSRGNARPVEGFSFGKPYRLHVAREPLGDMFKYAFSVDGVAVDSFVVKMPVNNRISFYGYKLTIEVDNFQLFRLPEGEASNNLAVNSSFEHLQEGRPNYMKPRLGGRYAFDGKWEAYLSFFAVDTEEKVHGEQSVRMTAGESPLAPTRNGVGTHNVNVVAETPVTFSVYLKASEDDFPVTLHLWELHHRNHSKRITVSREWARHTFTIEAPERAIVRGAVDFSQSGTVWADALQIEIGPDVTDYAPSSLDADKFGGGEAGEPVIPDDIVLHKTPQEPVIDGVLEPMWFEHGVKTDAFFLRGWEAPGNRTEAYLTCDAENLYIGIRAFVPDPENVAASEHAHDVLRVHSDECVELFLDSTFSRQAYHHLTLNAAGSRTDMGPGSLISWNGGWEGKTGVNAELKAVEYEFKIPLADFEDVNLSQRWGLNIGRNDRAANHVVSLIRTRQPNFHLPSLYPALVFPDGVLDAHRVSPEAPGGELTNPDKEAPTGSLSEIYTRLNYYMNEPVAVLVGSVRLPDSESLPGRLSVSGKAWDVTLDAEFALDIPLEGIENGAHPVTLDVFNGKEKLASATATLTRRPFKKGATQIDRQRRCLVVEGRPRLLIAPFFGVPRGVKPEDRDHVAANMLRHHTEAGYRDVMIGAVPDPPVAELTQMLFDRCAEANVKVLYWPFATWKRRETITPAEHLKTVVSDGIVGWLVIDEPELYAGSDEVEQFLKAYRAVSPYTPIFMNNTKIGIPSRFANLETDILMLDDYLTNREGRKVIEMIHETDMMWEAGREERKPVFYFLAGENLHNHYREPTYAEQIAQSYGVVIAGASGISYFLSLATYPEHYRALVDVNRELLALEDVILSLEPTGSARIANPVIRSITRRLGDSLYIIALNTDNDQPAAVEIALPPEWKHPGSAGVLFEDRSVAISNGRIADTFKPLERHVYVIERAD